MISVVVSIYKVEAYLNRCIESLLNQTYKDFELILIDDGSPDNCSSICDAWEKKDKKIRVYHKNNGGLSSARNYGIEQAKGEYVIFPDPDDWVEPEYLERLLALRKEHHADLSICGYYYNKDINNENRELSVYSTEEALEQLMLPRSFCGYAWNKLYSTDLINKYNLRFDLELGMIQDLHFNVRYFQYCKKIVYDSIPLYHYVIDGGGVTSRYTSLTPRKMSGLLAYKKIAEITHDNYPKVEEIAFASLCKMCLDDLMIYYKTGKKEKDKRNVLKKDFLKYRKKFLKSTAYTKEDKRFSRLVIIHPYLYYFARRFYWKFIIPVKRKKNR